MAARSLSNYDRVPRLSIIYEPDITHLTISNSIIYIHVFSINNPENAAAKHTERDHLCEMNENSIFERILSIVCVHDEICFVYFVQIKYLKMQNNTVLFYLQYMVKFL